MDTIQTYLKRAADGDYSDLFLIAGKTISARKGGEMTSLDPRKLRPEESEALIRELYQLAGLPQSRFLSKKDDDFSLSLAGLARFRVSAYRQRGSRAAVIRVVRFGIPDWRRMNIPPEIMKIADIPRGLVLLTGPAGSGKSTTLACLIDAVNRSRCAHIITIEDPIEYLHQNRRGIVSQRELVVDTDDAGAALRASLRQSPQVIVLEELRDPDTMETLLSAAETGRLVISTMYTAGAAGTIDRIIGAFPPFRQQMIRLLLSQTLQAVASQQLLPAADGGLVPAFELLRPNSAVRDMIREGRTAQIDTVLQSLAAGGMAAMDESLLRLCGEGRISRETALRAARNPDQLHKRMRMHMD